MSNKLVCPFGDKPLYITQTTHGVTGQEAIDCNTEPFARECYAEGEGVIEVIKKSGSASYIWIQYDGIDYVREFVHFNAKSTLKVGQRVVAGDYLGLLYSDGIFPAHLHWTFYDNKKIGNTPNPFSYLNQDTAINTKYAVIKNSNWFNSDGSFNWSLFPDLKLNNSSMENMKYTVNTKLRTAPSGDETGVVKAGSVGKVIGGPRVSEGYNWYDVAFGKEGSRCYNTGWIIEGARTDEAITCMDGLPIETVEPEPPVEPPVIEDPCESYKSKITELEVALKATQTALELCGAESQEKDLEISALESSNERLTKEVETLSTLNDGLQEIIDTQLERISELEEDLENCNSDDKGCTIIIIISDIIDRIKKLIKSE